MSPKEVPMPRAMYLSVPSGCDTRTMDARMLIRVALQSVVALFSHQFPRVHQPE